MSNIYPIRLSGIPKETIWGGDRIKNTFNADCRGKTGELWILSSREKEDCVILNGKHKGKTISEYLRSFFPELLPFPMLIKFIDANDRLSVQVHPDDEIALQLGSGAAGKTEMWHVIEAEEGATIVYGIKEGLSGEDLKKAVDDGCVEDVLNCVPVRSGDTFFIPAGLVHAIGKGILLAEVQQNSDTTYRFYDYGRLDANGNPRELHVEKALAATKLLSEKDIRSACFESDEPISDPSILADCGYFKVIKKSVNEKFLIEANDADFYSLVCLSGEGIITCEEETETVTAGDSFFIPRGVSSIEFVGRAELLISIPRK